MAYVLFSLSLFCASVMTHVFFCRCKPRPGLQAKLFFLISIFYTGVYAAGVFLVGKYGLIDAHSFWGMPFKLTAWLIFVLLIPLYLSFYTMTQLASPSRKILSMIARKGGLSYAEILAFLQEEGFIHSRLNELLVSGCISQNDGRFTINPSGQNLSALLDIMQHLLGRDIGG